MKFAKSCKIFLFIISLLAISLSSVQLLSVKDKAFAVASPSDAFSSTNATLTYEGGYLKADLSDISDSAKIKIKNKLAINDFEIEAIVGANVSEISVTLEYDSYYENGISKDFNADPVVLDDTIKSVLKITVNEDDYSLDFNGRTETADKDGNLTLGFSTLNNVITASVEDKTVANVDDYYKIAGKDKNVATITLEFKLAEGATDNKNLDIVYIDQAKQDDEHNFRQTFALDADSNINAYAYPVVSLNDDVFNTATGIQVIDATKYNFTLNAYSVFNKVQSSDLFLTAENDGNGTIALENSDKPKYARFNKLSADAEDVMVFGVASKDAGSTEVKVYEEYTVKVVDKDLTSTAPVYFQTDDGVLTTNEYKAFKIKLDKLIGEVRLGDKITIPSMKDLVKDDYTTYSKLTHTVYYKTPSNDVGSTTGWTLDINEAGDYLFYVMFKDEQGEEMDKDDFFTVDETDENVITYGDYKHFVFKFNIQDDEPFSVTEAESENKGKGFVGVKYKIKPFDVKGYDYTQNYLLYYNANVDATEEDEGWILVEEGENYTLEEIEKIAYDEQRTFTPDKKGAYMIECTAISNNEAKSATARTIIKIDGDVMKVKPLNTWFRDHLAPMIFLMIGSACLIVLVVLIFIKPKQPTTQKEETKAPKKK